MSAKNLVLQLWPKMLSIHQTAELFDHQHIWNESVDILVLLHGDTHQWKVVSETTTPCWM